MTPDATTDQLLPGEGTSLVGVALTRPAAGRAAAAGRPGAGRGHPPSLADPPVEDPDTISGQVVSVAGPDDSGLTTVDVLVPADEAAGLAARVATGRVALVLDSREP